jgi:hypothetical protein
MRRDQRIRNEAGRSVVLLLALTAGCGAETVGGATSGAVAAAGAMAVASDSTGTKLVMVGGGIWTSTDGGATWIDRAPSGLTHIQQWTSVASDATGTNLVAVVNGFYDLPDQDPAMFSGDVWTSTDSGATWTDLTPSGPAHGQAWRSVASDASGKNLVAATQGGGVLLGAGAIFTSTDAGTTWTNRTAAQAGTGNQSWASVASDATGQNLVAAGSGSGVWASSDGGLTWTDRTPVDPKYQATFGDQVEGWSSIASDATGTRLIAAVDAGDVWTSSDGGASWSDAGPATSSQIWVSVASDSTGTNLVAVNGGVVTGNDGEIWTSTNGGVTWTDLTAENAAASARWDAVASNAAGDHLVAIGRGAIWTN